MTIEAGQPVPQATFQIKTEDGVAAHDSTSYFAEGRTVLFTVPGAFTPTCSAKHLPSFIEYYDNVVAAGVDRIACLSVNDPHVMKIWGEQGGATGKIDMLADPLGDLSKALGLLVHMGPVLGERATRAALIIDDGVVTKVLLEEVGAFEVSSAPHVLTQL